MSALAGFRRINVVQRWLVFTIVTMPGQAGHTELERLEAKWKCFFHFRIIVDNRFPLR
jgi:hypothetical protein